MKFLTMTTGGQFNNLVIQARKGDQPSQEQLAKWAREKLVVYVYRNIMVKDLTEDIVQETLLEMHKVLGNLKKTELFWPWLRKIASCKISAALKKQNHLKTVSVDQEGDYGNIDSEQGLEKQVAGEVEKIVHTSMKLLKPRYRRALVMRCYENMEYRQIADELEISDFGARMLFMRAKNSLAKELSRRGLKKGALLTTLVLFGKMTAGSTTEAASVSVAPAALNVGAAAGVVGLVTSKAALVTLATAAVIAVGPKAYERIVGTEPAPLSYTSSVFAGIAAPSSDATDQKVIYYYPVGPTGPVWLRLSEEGRGVFLQNRLSNYYISNNGQTVTQRNCRMWNRDLSVWRLPTDTPELTAFLDDVEGKVSLRNYTMADSKGLWVSDTRNQTATGSQTTENYQYAVMAMEYFQPTASVNAQTVDNRDPMHKRGWTCFTISGKVNGQPVTGQGRIPFVTQTAYGKYSPWISLKVGNKEYYAENQEYPQGFARPWQGLHTIDTIRRDAAKEKEHFSTKLKGNNVEVKITTPQRTLRYTINMEQDLIEKINYFDNTGHVEGEIVFNYDVNLKNNSDDHQPWYLTDDQIDWMSIGR
ncbi:MAG: sigma-70 family RNA polymerase sigma factor [Phycisphaerae bacterium]|nr:sigma-70 family RNA polymerase sigma factor [Phycisphaerae bacterium]